MDTGGPNRKWISLGDLEASYDGRRYVDIRSKHKTYAKDFEEFLTGRQNRIFLSQGAIEQILALFPSVQK